MSGIYGIYRFDGAPLDPVWLERMKAAMAYYGPDGHGREIDGSVGLGHLLKKLNPEDAFESQPVRSERGLVVSAARLDNRDDLLEAFHISASEAVRITDGYLVSRAFERWGEELCPHLQGDWALAAWNLRERRLLLARDQFGSGNLYYHEGNGFIAFASSLKALLALPGVVKEPDRLRLAQLLVSWPHNAELTAYKGLRRLTGALAMTIATNGQARIWPYWSAEGRELLKYRRDEEYEEAFLEHYTRALRSCLRNQRPVAAELSGGRDSGSVVAVAAPLLAERGRGLTAYTAVPLFPPDGAGKNWFGNEWEQADGTATMAGANVRHVPIDAAEYGVIQGIEHFQKVHDQPSHGAINLHWIQAILETASRDGAEVIFTGQQGNASVSWRGNGSTVVSLLQGRLALALRQLLRVEPNPWLTLKRQILRPAIMPVLHALRRIKTPTREYWHNYSALNIEVGRELDMDGQMQAAGWDPTFTYSAWVDLQPSFFLPDTSIATGAVSEIGAWHSLSYLDPTGNLPLMEFLLRVPDDQFYRNGQGSHLYGRVFRKRIPEAVLKGERRGRQGADVGHRIRRELPVFKEYLSALNSLPEVREFIDMPLLYRSLDAIVTNIDAHNTDMADAILLRGLGVGLFLRHLACSSS